MFWRKNQKSSAPVIKEAIETDATSKKVIESTRVEKLPGPKPIPGILEKHLVADYKIDTDLVRIFKTVVHRRQQEERTFDFRIFDQSEAEAKEIIIRDYTSLDQNPDLILYEGWFNEDSKQVESKERRKINTGMPLLTEDEILQKIETLNKPGSSVFFYQNAGPAIGGPLGRGAVVVELNPSYPGKKQKKYIIHTANVVGMEPTSKRNKLYDTDKPKELARWIKHSHQKRIY